MAKYTTLFSIAAGLMAATNVVAQTPVVTLTNTEAQVVNGTTIQITAEVTDMDQLLGMGLNAENTSGTARTINVKRYELDVLHGTTNYFCWDLCYGERNAGASPVWIGADPIPMAAGATANGFHAYYKPKQYTGVSTFRYVWYDLAAENDSTWVDFVFNVTEPVGIEEVTAVRTFSTWPNPATGSAITVSYDLATAATGDRLAVYNLLGERKLVKRLGASQGQVVIGEDELASGVWFAVLERNGKAMATKRLVVVR
ncbi:MAG: T9SS type A sorting domain-containing protein [Flavobacteriales bacterium]|nr:T9SS type A sorting domain-containing protein [Flavobacteriales bacterium]MBP9079030.1 T9SS type A sorting domain-containing protein [Flavobacteriales bacterium]